MYPQSNDQRDQRDQREQRDQRDHSGEFGTALKIATFNLRNCALPHFQFYDNQDPYDDKLYRAKRDWTAHQIDAINADIIVFQEVFQVQALQEALQASRTMNQAKLIARDAVKMPPKNTWVPQVAIATKLPLLAEPTWVVDYGTGINLPDYAQTVTQITRAVPHITVKAYNGSPLHILGVHLKSKRPDYLDNETADNANDLALATYRSLMRRGADAVALRRYLNQLLKGNRIPCIIAGDFNDDAKSVTSQIIAGSGGFGKIFYDSQFFDTQRIQTRNDPMRNVVYTNIHQGSLEVLDQIFVTEEFHPQSRYQIAQVREVYCLNDHLHSREPHTSDHGIVVAQLLFKNKAD